MCKGGTYERSDKVCEGCHQTCLTCNDWSFKDCLDCIDGHALIGGECININCV